MNSSLRQIKNTPRIDEPIYKANVKCATFNQPMIQLDCGQLNFTLAYSTFSSLLNAKNNFIIDNKTASVYLTSKSIKSLPSKQFNYILLINSYLNHDQHQVKSNNKTNKNDRFISSAQTYISLEVPSSISSSIDPNILTFEKSLYKIQILNTLPTNTNILSMKYKYNNGLTEFSLMNEIDNEYSLSFLIENESNLQIETNFRLKHSFKSREIFLINLISPLPLDKPEINFNLRLSLTKRHSTMVVSTATTSVKILLVQKRPSVARLNFVAPDSANYVILPESINMNASIIYQFQTTVKTYDSLIVYSILNKEYTNLFFIDNTFLRVNFPFPDTVDKKRLNYLVKIFN